MAQSYSPLWKQRKKPVEEIFELESPSSGDELPKFGRDQNYIGLNSGDKKTICDRSVSARLADYWHPCVLRMPIKEVSKKSITQWKQKRYRTRPLDKYSRPIQVRYVKELHKKQNIIAAVAAECHRYQISADFSQCVKMINDFYSSDFAMRWEGLGKWKKYARGFDSIFTTIDEQLHSVLDKIDSIHRREYIAWQQKNQSDYASRMKNLQDRIDNKVIALKYDRSYRESQAAKEAANDAAAAAQAAEAEARKAQQSVNNVQWEIDRLRNSW